MKIVIQQACIIDPKSPYHRQVKDILIEDGVIRRISSDLPVSTEKVIAHQHLHVSPGWVDIFSDFGDPGYEYKETLETGANAAAAGGYTDVFIIPNTRPVIDTKAQVEYIRQKSASLPVEVRPIGAVSQRLEGKELAEMYDMQRSGAIAFGDGTSPVQSAGLMLKALQYVKAFGGTIIQIPDDKSIGAHGLMNEGIVSTRLGLPGKPMISEEIMVARDIKLARYADSKIHFTGISSLKSVEYIKRAKQKGLQVTCSVTPYHLFFFDDDLLDYDTNLKVNPPLRTKSEVLGLREALQKGEIDCISTHHLPHEYDSKILEFENAKFGMTGLQTTYSVLRTVLPDMEQARLIELLGIQPRKIFGLPDATISEGSPAALSLFDPNGSWTVGEGDLVSKSKNTPFVGRPLKGRALGIINGEHILFNP